MEKFVIHGGHPLYGEVSISGAKNAAVAILPAVILAEDVCVIENLPKISDVAIMLQILTDLGAKVRMLSDSVAEIDPRPIATPVATGELLKKMRASYYLIGALLGRFNQAEVALPGGCDFGTRPIDQHLKGFAALGGQATVRQGNVRVEAPVLEGSHIYLDVVSVGATMNIMLAAVKAKGMTVIESAAKEPHIVDLANFLNTMGADIRGAGTDVIKIYGKEHLGGATYSIIPDQIEAGTYMAAVAAAGGDVLVNNVIPKHLDSITAKLEEMGVEIEEFDEAVRVRRTKPLRRCNIKTMPHPGFPTDMQPQFGVLLAIANGTSILTEGVWDNRFRYIEELRRMGVQASVDGKIAVFEGVPELSGANVRSTDLRAGAALIIAGLVAKGETQIDSIVYIDRGYENVVEKFTGIGADIERREFPDEAVIAKAL